MEKHALCCRRSKALSGDERCNQSINGATRMHNQTQHNASGGSVLSEASNARLFRMYVCMNVCMYPCVYVRARIWGRGISIATPRLNRSLRVTSQDACLAIGTIDTIKDTGSRRQSINQSINQSIYQYINQSTNSSINQFINQPTTHNTHTHTHTFTHSLTSVCPSTDGAGSSAR
jgi:hypothetical protein